MKKKVSFDTIKAFNDFNNHPTLHPLVSVLDFSRTKPRTYHKMRYGIYVIYFKEVVCGDLRYGKHHYDYQEDTLVFVGPRQVVEVENTGEIYQPKGRAIAFHSDLTFGTPLADKIDDYGFFSYQLNEALHLSPNEQKVILDCYAKIAFELEQTIDRHSHKLIAANIELLLSYCERFYDRQFLTRNQVNQGLLAHFEDLLQDYFKSEKPERIGLPSVTYFAQELNLSSNYFGDLIKKKTGHSAQEYIQNKVIEVAKGKIFGTDKNISEIAYEMGFKYPNHFSRTFKNSTGYTPKEFRNLN